LNTTGIKLYFDFFDSKDYGTFVWVTYELNITRVESDGKTTTILTDLFQSKDGPLVLDIQQGNLPVTIVNATQEPYFDA